MLRSLASIAAGFVTWSVLFLGSNRLLDWTFPATVEVEVATSGTGMLLVILALSIVYSTVAGWVTFKVDRVRALGSSLALGVLLLGVGIMVQLQYRTILPLWYHLCFLGALIPAVLLGYRLAVTRS